MPLLADELIDIRRKLQELPAEIELAFAGEPGATATRAAQTARGVIAAALEALTMDQEPFDPSRLEPAPAGAR